MTSEKEIFDRNRAFARWKPAAWLRVAGADAADFLQGQFTNDLRKLGGEGAVYGLWLNHKGRVLADSFLLRGAAAGEFWLGSYFSDAAVIRERLESFIIADDVAVEDHTKAYAGVSVSGADAGPLAGVNGAVGFRGRRSSDAAYEIVFPGEHETEVLARLAGVPELSAEEMERRRILAGIPAIPRDIGAGELPNEGRLEHDAISYTKGCYLGQEVMARLKSMGQVRRRLLRVKGRGGAPALPADLFQGDKKVGELRSAASGDEFVGLALLSLLNLRVDVPLSFAPGGEPRVKLAESP